MDKKCLKINGNEIAFGVLWTEEIWKRHSCYCPPKSRPATDFYFHAFVFVFFTEEVWKRHSCYYPPTSRPATNFYFHTFVFELFTEEIWKYEKYTGGKSATTPLQAALQLTWISTFGLCPHPPTSTSATFLYFFNCLYLPSPHSILSSVNCSVCNGCPKLEIFSI